MAPITEKLLQQALALREDARMKLADRRSKRCFSGPPEGRTTVSSALLAEDQLREFLPEPVRLFGIRGFRFATTVGNGSVTMRKKRATRQARAMRPMEKS